jgi:hypothetical protein
MADRTNRRDFLKTTALAGAGFWWPARGLRPESLTEREAQHRLHRLGGKATATATPAGATTTSSRSADSATIR